VLGYADDAIIVALVLRSATRKAGADALAKHWPGTPEGLSAVQRLCRLNGAKTPGIQRILTAVTTRSGDRQGAAAGRYRRQRRATKEVCWRVVM
jgi:hypothetical protein